MWSLAVEHAPDRVRSSIILSFSDFEISQDQHHQLTALDSPSLNAGALSDDAVHLFVCLFVRIHLDGVTVKLQKQQRTVLAAGMIRSPCAAEKTKSSQSEHG